MEEIKVDTRMNEWVCNFIALVPEATAQRLNMIFYFGNVDIIFRPDWRQGRCFKMLNAQIKCIYYRKMLFM